MKEVRKTGAAPVAPARYKKTTEVRKARAPSTAPAQHPLPPKPPSTAVPRPAGAPPAAAIQQPAPLSTQKSPHEQLIADIQGKSCPPVPQPSIALPGPDPSAATTSPPLEATGPQGCPRRCSQSPPLEATRPQGRHQCSALAPPLGGRATPVMDQGPGNPVPVGPVGSKSRPPEDISSAPPPKRRRSCWLIRTITKIINSPAQRLSKPPFQFELSEEAAEANFATLRKHNMDLQSIIDSAPFSPMSYGSEFKPTSVLEPLFHAHPRWPRMKHILAHGSEYYLEPISEEKRLGDIDGRLKYGNHKSAQGDRAEILASKMEKEVKHGWNIPLLPSHLQFIPEAEMAPMGLPEQAGINELGQIVLKDRPTHDMSFPGEVSETSVNDRVRDEDLAPLQYGFMFLRIVHYIVQLRIVFPLLCILIRKDDFKSAYRRQHLRAIAAVKTIVQIVKGGITFLLLALRLTFGGKPGPSEWCTISEPICDLANEILNCEEWDPESLHSPHQHRIPSPVILDPSIPFAQGKPMMVDVPLEKYGKCDQYIDDTTTIGVDTGEESRRRLEAAMPLATYVVAREIAEDEPIAREDIMSFEKMQAEGGLAEAMVVLGWLLDTRRLLVSLPEHKYIAWVNQIDAILFIGHTNVSELDTLIGRLNHAATVIPLARHFLSRLRALKAKGKSKWSRLNLSKAIINDLELWKTLLLKAKEGISMNLLTFREPNRVYRSDACEHGLGGFNSDGRAWRWMIPLHLLGRAHIGLLEFLAELVNIWTDVIEGTITAEDCALVMGDSTTAVGWIRKSNYVDTDEDKIHDQTAKLRVARKMADITINNDIKLYSQWFPGEDNIIPDILSPAPQIQDCGGPARDRLVSLLRSAGLAIESATTEDTQAKRVRAWRIWKEFLPTIGIEGDDFMEAFTTWQRQIICTAFCQAVREGTFTTAHRKRKDLVKDTVADTIGLVAQAFRSAQRPDPRLDVDGKQCYLLQQVLRGYSNLDPPTKPQKALPFSVLLKMHQLAAGQELPTAIAELCMGAWFFAMRSCEYSKTSYSEESKRTKILRVRNIRFFRQRRLIPHSSAFLHLADYVDITFEYQKNDERNESVGMYRSKSEEFHAVSVWASIIRRLWSYEGTTMDTTVNTCHYLNAKGKLVKIQISSQRIRTKLRAAAGVIGEDVLGFKVTEIGTHSIRSGAAMALYLALVPTLTIMIIGRWKSDAFVRYIRKQVALFSHNLTDKMLQSTHFFTTPDFDRIQEAASAPSFTTQDTEIGPSRHWGTYDHMPTDQDWWTQ